VRVENLSKHMASHSWIEDIDSQVVKAGIKKPAARVSAVARLQRLRERVVVVKREEQIVNIWNDSTSIVYYRNVVSRENEYETTKRYELRWNRSE